MLRDGVNEVRYQPWDRYEKLGEPPWSGPALKAWEAAHGHDVRLKCYPEFGCQLLHGEEEFQELLGACQELIGVFRSESGPFSAAGEEFVRFVELVERMS